MGKSAKTSRNEHAYEEIEIRLKHYPPRIMTYLILAGISSAFLVLSVAYLFTTFRSGFNNFHLPLLFHANTALILVSSYSMEQCRRAAANDDLKGYITGLLVTLALGAAFVGFQIAGWFELSSVVDLKSNIAGTYICVISGMHMVHLLAGIVLLGIFSWQAFEMKTNPVKELLFESNPFSKLKVNLLSLYWHFVDGLWVYLYLFFLLNIYVLR